MRGFLLVSLCTIPGAVVAITSVPLNPDIPLDGPGQPGSQMDHVFGLWQPRSLFARQGESLKIRFRAVTAYRQQHLVQLQMATAMHAPEIQLGLNAYEITFPPRKLHSHLTFQQCPGRDASALCFCKPHPSPFL